MAAQEIEAGLMNVDGDVGYMVGVVICVGVRDKSLIGSHRDPCMWVTVAVQRKPNLPQPLFPVVGGENSSFILKIFCRGVREVGVKCKFAADASTTAVGVEKGGCRW